MTHGILTNGAHSQDPSSNEQDASVTHPPATASGTGPTCPDSHFKQLFARLTKELAIVATDAVVPDLDVPTKEEAICALVARLASADVLSADDQAQTVAAVLRREELATTGIGRGIGIPHTKHPTVRRLAAAVAHIPAGIDFDAVDGEPVFLVVLLLSPVGQTREHLVALEGVSRLLQ